jgi:uncharacterized membrane protein YagU involved in acid resistance
MVRWSEGLLGGLIAGVTSAGFFAVVAAAWPHETTVGEFFAQNAQALPPLRHLPVGPVTVMLGVVLHLALAIAFGITYASLAGRMRSMQKAPTSVLWGLSYGLVVWVVLNDVVVPLVDADVVQPLWEGLLGTMVFYGAVLSEFTTVAIRREARDAP